MSFNPNAAAFMPQTRDTTSENGSNVPFEEDPESVEAIKSSHRKQQYENYKARRRAAVHTTLRAAYESARLTASLESNVYDDNAKDKLIVDMVRLLAGLGWSTSTVLRAAVSLEMDQTQDALKCLQEAKQMGQEFHQRQKRDLGEDGGEGGSEA